MQARLNQSDPRLYNAGRDVAHNFGDVMREVAQRFELCRWPEMNKLLEREKITDPEVAQALAAFCFFVQSATERPKESMGDCLDRSGFLACKPTAQIAVLAMLGTVMSGYYWSGVREATMQGVGPAMNYQDLRWHGRHAVLLMSQPRWKRRMRALWRRVQNTWKALIGHDAIKERNDRYLKEAIKHLPDARPRSVGRVPDAVSNIESPE